MNKKSTPPIALINA